MTPGARAAARRTLSMAWCGSYHHHPDPNRMRRQQVPPKTQRAAAAAWRARRAAARSGREPPLHWLSGNRIESLLNIISSPGASAPPAARAAAAAAAGTPWFALQLAQLCLDREEVVEEVQEGLLACGRTALPRPQAAHDDLPSDGD
eukprot:CAMPEP_0182875176 /NCGR_PEP_ID=MMETSP0034_2-20130328/13387_1 /TAXON_ID=156128 /ORGANISM="Nephroselmis pyriformis, Strain CCMP717" /LENGTH=146 /DNA_ID=CAMNT_0025007909 /DNA_START=102 /DNA_END=540 /DNA_ORIENTATION=-